jgi:hypothetical protein
MKTLVIALAVISIAALAQEYQFPGWTCTDAAQFQAQIALAPTPSQKATVAYMAVLVQNPPASLAEAIPAIDAAIDQYAPDTLPAVRLLQHKKYAYCLRKWVPELLAYCQANPCGYDIYVASRFPSAWSVQRLQECLLTTSGSNIPVAVSAGITALNDYAIKGEFITAAEAKEAFIKIDRFYTAKLAEDKDKWAPIVAKIRTILDRY